MKFLPGSNKFRIVSSAIVGYEYWTENNKPVRMKSLPAELPIDIRKGSSIKHFWAFTVIDRKDGKLKICEITQSTIMQAIKALIDNEDWGNPKDYDITIVKSGDGLETQYTVQPSPHKANTQEEFNMIENTKVNLSALFSGGNPFEEEIPVIPEEEVMTRHSGDDMSFSG